MTNKPYDVYKELADTKLALLQAERRADNAVKMSNLTLQQLADANEQLLQATKGLTYNAFTQQQLGINQKEAT